MAAVYCTRCGRTITDDEMEDGLVVETEKGLFCSECVPHIQDSATPKERPAPDPTPPAADPAPAPRPAARPVLRGDSDEEDDPVDLLKRILDEVKPINRSIMYERASVWNVLGGVTQIFAFAALLFCFTQWEKAPEPWLLLALVLQAATLTFFVKGK